MSDEIVVAFGFGATVSLIVMLFVWHISDRLKQQEEIHRMTVKECLESVRLKRAEVESIKSELAYLRENMDLLSGIDYSAPRVVSSPDGDSAMINVISRIQILEDKLAKKLDVLLSQVTEIEISIRCISDDTLRVILFDRYINDMSFADIAEKMNYSERQIYTLHKIALNSIIILHPERFQ